MDPIFGPIIAAGITSAAQLGGGLLSGGAQAANNAAMMSQQWQRDQFNAQQVAMNNATNWNWTQQTNQENRDFIWQTNLQNEAFQRETNLWNAAQVQKQMDFQERLSGSAYQRAMADMRAAGLNPILAYQQGGASSMPGAAPVGIAPKNIAPQYIAPRSEAAQIGPTPRTEAATGLGNAISGMATSALDAIGKIAAIDKTRSETENLKHTANLIVEQVSKTADERENIQQATVKLQTEILNNTALHRVLAANGVTAEQAIAMGLIDLAQAAATGGKYGPSAYEQIVRGIMKSISEAAGWKPGDKLPEILVPKSQDATPGQILERIPRGLSKNDPGNFLFVNPMTYGDRK